MKINFSGLQLYPGEWSEMKRILTMTFILSSGMDLFSTPWQLKGFILHSDFIKGNGLFRLFAFSFRAPRCSMNLS